MVHAAPRTLKFLKILVVHDLVHLGRDQPVDLGDPRIDRDIHILGHRQLAAHHLIDKFADHVFSPLFLKIVAGHTAIG